MRRPEHARQSDDAIGRQTAPVGELERPAARRDRLGAREDLDVVARQQVRGEGARGRAEERERRVLGGREPDHRGRAAPAQLGGAQQGELVKGEGPRGARRSREGDAPRLRGEQLADRLALARAAEGQRATDRIGRMAAGRDEQHVVGELVAGAGHGHAGAGADRAQRVGDHGDVLVGSEGRERHAPARDAAEGLQDRQRAVVEAAAGREQRDVQVGGAQALAQGQAGLERRNAAPGDDDARMVGGGCGRHGDMFGPAAVWSIGAGMRAGCGFATVASAPAHGWRGRPADLRWAGVRLHPRRPRRSHREPRRPRPRHAARRSRRDDRRGPRAGDVGRAADRRHRGGRAPPRRPARRRPGGLRRAGPRSARALSAALRHALRRCGRGARPPRATRRDRRRAEPPRRRARDGSAAGRGAVPGRPRALRAPLRPRLRAGPRHRRVRGARESGDAASGWPRRSPSAWAPTCGSSPPATRPRRSGWPTPRDSCRSRPRRASQAAAPVRWWPRRAGTSTSWSPPDPDDEILRQAACPVLVVPAAARVEREVAGRARR